MLLCLWDFPGKNTGVGCHLLLQGIFPTQGLNPQLLCLLHGQSDPLPLHYLWSMRDIFYLRKCLSPFCLKSTDLISVTIDYYYFFFYCSRLVTQSWPTLCDLVECSPLGSSVHGLLQARILGWVAISFSRGSSWPRDWTPVSCIAGIFLTDWAELRRKS